MDGMYYNLWSADNEVNGINTNQVVKTVYDPSPAGFCMPPSGAFTGFTTSGNNTLTSTDFNVSGAWDNGWNFFCGLNRTGETIYFPASGVRHIATGEATGLGSNGYCWSAAPNTTYGRSLSFSATYVNPQTYGSGRCVGHPVRPVKEQ